MASTPAIITERPATRAAAALLALLLAAPVVAHETASRAVRELIRIQGQLGTATPPAGGHQLTFVALGQRLPFTAAEWRVFAFADSAPAAPPPAAPQLVGDRSLLRRITTARPDQRLTVLAERRPGGTDLFVLAVDRCPE